MSEEKNVKVGKQVHELLCLRAMGMGMKKQVLASALLEHSLNLPEEEILRIVVNAQLKPR